MCSLIVVLLLCCRRDEGNDDRDGPGGQCVSAVLPPARTVVRHPATSAAGPASRLPAAGGPSAAHELRPPRRHTERRLRGAAAAPSAQPLLQEPTCGQRTRQGELVHSPREPGRRP